MKPSTGFVRTLIILAVLIVTLGATGWLEQSAQAQNSLIQRTTADIMAQQQAHDASSPRDRQVRIEVERRDETRAERLGGKSGSATEEAPSAVEPGREPSPAVALNSSGDFLTCTLADCPAFPPDTMGAVGPTQFVSALNGRFRVHDKLTGTLGALNVDPDVFFAPVKTPGIGTFTSDPRVRYDIFSQRWIFIMIDVPPGFVNNRLMIAVSDGPAITNDTVWTYYYFQQNLAPTTGNNNCLLDYPTLGVDVNALYIGGNMFCDAITTYGGTSGFVIRKAFLGAGSSDLLAGPGYVTAFRGLALPGLAGPYTPQGVDNYDPGATEGYFIGVDNATFGTMMIRRVSNPGSATPTISGNIALTLGNPTSFPFTVPHQGNTGGANGRLDALDDRLMQAVMRNGRLWTAHTIATNSGCINTGGANRDIVRWYEITDVSATPSVAQSGFICDGTGGPNPNFYFIPSVMVNGQGHAVIGFSASGNLINPAAAYTSRLAGDLAGFTEPVVIYEPAGGAYNPPGDPGGASGRRWGDYSYTSLDPCDDMTFYTIQEYASSANNWGTRVARILAPPPAVLPGSSGVSIQAGTPSTVIPLTGTTANGEGFYDTSAGTTDLTCRTRLTASATGGITVNGITWDSASQVTVDLNASAAAPGTQTLTITNPDGQTTSTTVEILPSMLTIDDVTHVENEGGATTDFVFTVTLSPAAASTVTVNWATADGTATAASGDYDAGSGTLTFLTGESQQTITVTVNDDAIYEADETFFVALSNPSGAQIGDGSGLGTILNDNVDPAPTLSIDDISELEGDAGTTGFTFTVTLTGATEVDATVNFTTADGTATAGSDYTGSFGTLTFLVGDTSETITVSVNGDTTFENDETFTVLLSGAVDAAITGGTGAGTILNDDTMPSLAINDVSDLEGNAGTISFDFEVTLTGNTEVTVTVDYATADGTASSLSDYTAAGGTLTFNPGVTSQPVGVLVNGDTVFETDETFTVGLSNVSGATISDGTGLGTIEDDDDAPTLSINDVSMNEGDAGTTSFTFTVTLTGDTGVPASVDFATVDGTATVAGNDYQSTGGTLNFAPGVTTQPITVLVNGDTTFEANETFTVSLSNASGATILDGTGTGTILNDEGGPLLSIDDVSIAEGDSGPTALTFTVTRTGTTTQPFSVDFMTVDGIGPDGAVQPGDYAFASGTLNFSDTDFSKTFTVDINGDTTYEHDETFTVVLSNPTGGAVIGDDSGIGTILNDDAAPVLAIDDVQSAEGDAGTTSFTFTVTLTGETAENASVNYATADGTASSLSDFAAASGTLNFTPLDASETITVLVNGDTTFEGNETFSLVLWNPIDAQFGDETGIGTIDNDDAMPALAIGDATLNEGNAGTTAFNFDVVLVGATELPVSVSYATVDGTASSFSDYTAASGTLNFAPGDAIETITVLVNGDTAFEDDESFTVVLSGESGATIADGSGQGTILNDDGLPTLSISDVSLNEGNGGTTPFNFIVTLSSVANSTVTVSYMTMDGTAASPGDYAAGAGTLTFNSGETIKTITVPVNGDTEIEPDETFTVMLSGESGAIIADGSGLGTILNDDAVIATELLVNNSFEDAFGLPLLDPWKVKNATKDKIKCNKPEKNKFLSYDGQCAFRFKGNPIREHSKVIQAVDLAVHTIDNGEPLYFSAYVDVSAGTNAKVKIKIKYNDATPRTKYTLPLAATVGYQQITGQTAPESGDIQQVKVMVKNNSTGGKFYVDLISLIKYD